MGMSPVGGLPAADWEVSRWRRAAGQGDAGAMNTDFAILAATALSPSHPYQLLEHLQALGVSATRSTLYRRVDALAAAGRLGSTDERGPSGHFRRALALTTAGRDWLVQECEGVLRREAPGAPLAQMALAVLDREGLAGRVLRTRLAVAARDLTREERALRDSAAAAPDQILAVARLQAEIAWMQGELARPQAGPAGGTLRAG